MADDDIFAAIATGLLEGVERVGLPYLTRRHEDELLRRRQAQTNEMEFEQYKRKLPLEEASKIRIARETPIAVYDESGRPVSYVPRGSRTLPVNKKPRKIITSDQAQQLRNAGVDINDQEYVIHDASSASTKDEEKKDIANWSISEIDRIMPLNEKSSGGLIGGLRQKGMSALNIEDEKFRNTADVINSARSMVADVLKSKFGGQLSDSEREYLNSVYGAIPNYSVAERRIALRNVKRMFQNKIGRTFPTSGSGATEVTETVGGNEVERQTRDGRIAVFDADTKKFLRYK